MGVIGAPRGRDGWQWMSRLLLGLAIMVITIFPTASAAERDDPPRSVVPDDVEKELRLVGQRAENGKLELVSVTGQPFKTAARITTFNDPGTEWNLQVATATSEDVKRGDVVLATFYLRCIESMTGEGFTGFVLEENHEPYDKAAELRVGAGKAWLQCFVPFKAERDFPAGQTQICFRAGFDRQTIEIGGIELINHGPGVDLASLPRTKVTYAGRDANAAWRKAALEQIERIRKAPITVRVVDAAGKPVPNASVHVDLKRHAFGFGSCVVADQITGTSPDDAKAREIIEKYFNRVVFENDMKWYATWDGVPEKVDRAVDWLRERNIEVRGHNLIWPSWQWSPRQLREYENDPAKLRQLCAEHVSDTVRHFKGKLVHWDVVNEPYNNVDLLNLLGRDVMVDWFKLAKESDPDCLMFLNDFGIFDGGPGSEHRAHFYDTIRHLRDKGAPIDGIGIQSHFGAMVPPPAQLTAVLDQFAQFGLPIESTEFSINSDDRALQADYLRDYMIAVFAHPKVQGIMLWGFWEGRHWRPHAALWTQDWQLRPHGKVWADLLEKDWNTDQTLKTDADGVVRLRGFLGTYDVSVTNGSARANVTATLPSDGLDLPVTLTP